MFREKAKNEQNIVIHNFPRRNHIIEFQIISPKSRAHDLWTGCLFR